MGASDSSIWITDFNLATTSTTNFKWYWFPVLLDHDIGYFYRAIFVPDGSWLGMSSFNCPKNSVTILRFKIIHNRFFTSTEASAFIWYSTEKLIISSAKTTPGNVKNKKLNTATKKVRITLVYNKTQSLRLGFVIYQ